LSGTGDVMEMTLEELLFWLRIIAMLKQERHKFLLQELAQLARDGA